jgi:hypothetical protein
MIKIDVFLNSKQKKDSQEQKSARAELLRTGIKHGFTVFLVVRLLSDVVMMSIGIASINISKNSSVKCNNTELIVLVHTIIFGITGGAIIILLFLMYAMKYKTPFSAISWVSTVYAFIQFFAGIASIAILAQCHIFENIDILHAFNICIGFGILDILIGYASAICIYYIDKAIDELERLTQQTEKKADLPTT